MSRQRVVVLFGGKSVEREVSRISARTIVQALDPAKYEVIALGIGPDGHFVSAAASARMLSEKGVPERFLDADETKPARPEVIVPAEISRGKADVVFPIIHGTTGEDGALQGFLEVLGLPYVGAGVTASAIGMDKAAFKALLRDAGLPTPRSVVLRVSDRRPKGWLPELPLPVFVKPANGGSSVGVSKVKNWSGLEAALALAFRYDDRALVEEGIDARELECAVLGNEEPKASVVGEIVPGHEFYDYDDKYRDDKAKLLIPAPVSEGVSNEVRRLAVKAFRLCGIRRNPDAVGLQLPGFTAISMYPKLWEASGMSLRKLLNELIRLALERKQKRGRLSYEPPTELK